MKYKLITLSLTLFLTQPNWAVAPSPTACPEVTAIKEIGARKAVKSSMMGWIAYNMKQSYNTPQQWTFSIAGIDAKSEEEAITKANYVISTLSLQEGPIRGHKQNEWGCLYVAGSYFALATTPPDNSPPSMMLSRYIH
ncbi:MAG: DUF4949 domain-containing protein [Gammaproteobacteria bacterium]|nr:DUF4949 domain-containing protein [Gammaproteobacteria bacterium]